MKHLVLIICLAFFTNSLFAKNNSEYLVSDTAYKKGDSTLIQLGDVKILIGKNSISIMTPDSTKKKISKDGFCEKEINKKPKTPKNIKTGFFMLDLGLSNLYVPNSGLAANYTGKYINDPMNLRYGKSINVALYPIKQKINLYQHNLNFIWGLGVNWDNYRFTDDILLNRDPASKTLAIRNDSTTAYSKNKFTTSYLTLPLLLEINNGKKGWHKFSVGAGVSINQLLNGYVKRVEQNGHNKFKNSGNYNLNEQRLGAVGTIGIGKLKFYGNYALTPLLQGTNQKENFTPESYPWNVGITLVGW